MKTGEGVQAEAQVGDGVESVEAGAEYAEAQVSRHETAGFDSTRVRSQHESTFETSVYADVDD